MNPAPYLLAWFSGLASHRWRCPSMMKISSPFAVLNMVRLLHEERPARLGGSAVRIYRRLLWPSSREVVMGPAQRWERGPTAGGPQTDMEKFSSGGGSEHC